MMEKQNVTLALPRDMLKKAKAVAADQHKSLSELLRETLEARIRNESNYRSAMRRQLAVLRKGFDLGTEGRRVVSRDELHYSFWDSLIIGAALKSGAGCLFSEDLATGQVLEGIEIRNPFLEK